MNTGWRISALHRPPDERHRAQPTPTANIHGRRRLINRGSGLAEGGCLLRILPHRHVLLTVSRGSCRALFAVARPSARTRADRPRLPCANRQRQCAADRARHCGTILGGTGVEYSQLETYGVLRSTRHARLRGQPASPRRHQGERRSLHFRVQRKIGELCASDSAAERRCKRLIPHRGLSNPPLTAPRAGPRPHGL